MFCGALSIFFGGGDGEKRLNHSGRMTRKWNDWLVGFGGRKKVSEKRHGGGVVFFGGQFGKVVSNIWVIGFCINW